MYLLQIIPTRLYLRAAPWTHRYGVGLVSFLIKKESELSLSHSLTLSPPLPPPPPHPPTLRCSFARSLARSSPHPSIPPPSHGKRLPPDEMAKWLDGSESPFACRCTRYLSMFSCLVWLCSYSLVRHLPAPARIALLGHGAWGMGHGVKGMGHRYRIEYVL
jgi:hypothetical protein